jgi:hypothetical protein
MTDAGECVGFRDAQLLSYLICNGTGENSKDSPFSGHSSLQRENYVRFPDSNLKDSIIYLSVTE